MSTWLGPVSLEYLFEPQLTVIGTPTALGIQQATLTGLMEWRAAHQLRELAANPHRQVTVGGQSGVLEVCWFGDNGQLRPLTGWMLLQSFQLGQVDQTHSLEDPELGLVPYTMTAAFLGPHRQGLVARSARDKGNDFAIAPSSAAANPFWDEVQAGGTFVADPPGAARYTREYDASFPHVTPRDVPDEDEDRNLSFYVGAFGGGVDSLPPLLLPTLPQPSSGIPNWITDRGGDVRAYDRREMREVYGPSHRFALTSDLLVTNGLDRFWVGNKGLPAFLNVEAFSAGIWREVGTVQVANGATLLDARLIKVTPEIAVVSLVIQGHDELTVTLRRAGRTFALGSEATAPAWKGTPPATWLTAAANGAGKFGWGLDAGGDNAHWSDPSAHWSDPRFHWDGTRVEPEVRLRWPPSVQESAWTRVMQWRPNKAAADLLGCGLRTQFDEGGAPIVTTFLDAADNKIKAQIGAHVAATPAQTFAAGADVFVAVRFSTTNGLGVSAGSSGVLAHAVDVTATDPGTTKRYYDHAYYTNDGIWGVDTWGDGVWGGVTSYPDGVISNDMLFDRWLSNAELAALFAGVRPLDGLPDPEGCLVWYAPFAARPIPLFGPETGGLQIETSPDNWGFTRALAALRTAKDEMAVVLARSDAGDRPAEHQRQFAAESEQAVRVR